MANGKAPLSRRAALIVSAVGVVILGLALHYLSLGGPASLATDALYTVLVYLVLAVIAPRAPRRWLALVAFAVSAAVEFAQLTGVPAQLAESFPPSRLVFGTTFSGWDLAAYAVGAVAVWAADRATSRQWLPSRLE
jgi:hypothetical protein